MHFVRKVPLSSKRFRAAAFTPPISPGTGSFRVRQLLEPAPPVAEVSERSVLHPRYMINLTRTRLELGLYDTNEYTEDLAGAGCIHFSRLDPGYPVRAEITMKAEKKPYVCARMKIVCEGETALQLGMSGKTIERMVSFSRPFMEQGQQVWRAYFRLERMELVAANEISFSMEEIKQGNAVTPPQAAREDPTRVIVRRRHTFHRIDVGSLCHGTWGFTAGERNRHSNQLLLSSAPGVDTTMKLMWQADTQQASIRLHIALKHGQDVYYAHAFIQIYGKKGDLREEESRLEPSNISSGDMKAVFNTPLKLNRDRHFFIVLEERVQQK